MLPRVVIHNGMSVDGRWDGFTGDVGLFYELAARWPADAILAGSNTMLAAAPAQADEPAVPPPCDPADPRPLAAVVDSRGRNRLWNYWRRQPYWRDVVALCSHSTPPAFLDSLRDKRVDPIVAGDDHVDLRAALHELNARYGVKLVRVDSGGTLNGVLLRAGLVDEVSVLVSPSLAGGTTPRSIFVAPDLASPEGVVRLRLTHVEQMAGDCLWVRYDVLK